MELREILKSIANSGGMATSRSVAILMNTSVPKASAYMTRLYKKGWVSRQRMNFSRGGYIYIGIIAPKGRQYLTYMAKSAQQPKPSADPILVAGLMDENLELQKKLSTTYEEDIKLLKELSVAKAEIVKKNAEISELKDGKDFWLTYSMYTENKYKNKYNETLSVLNEAMNVLRMR